MAAEVVEVPDDAVREVRQAQEAGRRVIAVGTTAVRALESAAAGSGVIQSFKGPTDLFVTPGFPFRVVRSMVTNFHLPRTTLLMLVSALIGVETLHAAYREAVREKYRFYSYGDAMLIL
jgi:S-adenosylmethionine:tRNA ribosyltransferase-isomerase